MKGCFECGSTDRLAKHHVVPRSKGGTRTVWLCLGCHGKVHSRRMTNPHLTRAALAVKKAKGEFVGRVPYGYDLADDGVRLLKNAAEQKGVAFIVGLHRAGMTNVSEITRLLTFNGYPTKYGGTWRWQTVRRILVRVGVVREASRIAPKDRTFYDCHNGTAKMAGR